MSEEGRRPAANATRCPHEDNWYCKLLQSPCHPGIKGCALDGQPLIDALIAFNEKQDQNKGS